MFPLWSHHLRSPRSSCGNTFNSDQQKTSVDRWHGMSAVCAVCSNLKALQFSKNKKPSFKAFYFSRHDRSFSVDITQLLSIRYFYVSKKRAQIWLQFIESPMWAQLLGSVSPKQIRHVRHWLRLKGETVRECIFHRANLTLMKLYWNISWETWLPLEHLACGSVSPEEWCASSKCFLQSVAAVNPIIIFAIKTLFHIQSGAPGVQTQMGSTLLEINKILFIFRWIHLLCF